ncbi:MAG TPA: hypothetical protein VFR39_03000 [Burkholderiales bacterium]|nr:hypothetical protein [Burkholderiales bacterium]
MNRKRILALVIAVAFAAPIATAYAQSDEKEPKKPEQSQLYVADGDDAYPKGSTPDLIAQSDEKEPKKPELAA